MKIKTRLKKIYKKHVPPKHRKQILFIVKQSQKVAKSFNSKIVSYSKLIKNKFARRKKTLEDLLSRKIFAKEIAEKISREHGLGKNVVLAISAKWGSGKTTLLEYIEPELKTRGFKVVLFNAWIYSQEPLSLKRSFLKTLKNGLNSHVNIDDLHFDTTRVSVNYKPFILLALLIISLFFIPFLYNLIVGNLIAYPNNFEAFIKKSLEDWEYIYQTWISPYFFVKSIIFASFSIPLLALIPKLFSFEKTTARITEADGFKQKFEQIIGKSKRVVVFVDDLDRCTPEAVKDILDALTTFFGHKNCSFIVTGDHTVIERYVGSKLFIDPIINDNGEENKKSHSNRQKTEGRRFLKKIFHVYWQLPEPDPNTYKKFTLTKVEESGLNLDKNQIKQLTDLLTTFLDKNLREVIRFIDALMFTHNTIKNIIEERELALNNLVLEDLEKKVAERDIKNLKTVLSQPVLLAKTLLIQELFHPIYELHIQNPTDILLQEKSLRGTKKLETIFTTPIGNRFYDDIQSQNKYIELIKSQPTFTGDNNETKYDPDTFWYLSGVTGLPSNKGPDADRFLQLIKLPDSFEEIEKGLKEASPEMTANLLDITKEYIKSVADPADKQNSITNSIKLANVTGSWTSLVKFISNVLKAENYVSTLEVEAKKDLMANYFSLAFNNNLETEAIFTDEHFTTDEINKYKWEALEIVASYIHSDIIDKLASLIESNLQTTTDPTEAFTKIGILAKKVNPEDHTAKTRFNELIKKVIDWAYLQTDLELFKLAINTVISQSPETIIKDYAISKQSLSLDGEEWSNIQNRLQFLAGTVHEFYGRTYLNHHITSYLTKVLEKDIDLWQPIVTDLFNKQVITKDTSISAIGEKLLSYLRQSDPTLKQKASQFLVTYRELRGVELENTYIKELVNLVRSETDITVVLNLLNVIGNYIEFFTGQEKEKRIIKKLAKSENQSIADVASSISEKFPTRKKKIASMEAKEAV